MRSVRATQLKAGDVLALPFGKQATIATVEVGRRFVNLRYCEEGISNGRIERGQEVMIEDRLPRQRQTFASIYLSIIVACDTLIDAEQKLEAIQESQDVMALVRAAVKAARALKEDVQ